MAIVIRSVKVATTFPSNCSTNHPVRRIKLLHIYFQYFKIDVFIVSILVSTQPYLNVITGWGRDLFPEPWWRVEVTAGAVLPTSSTIPERIISVEDELVIVLTASVTEVVISNEVWYWRRLTVAYVSAGTYVYYAG